jgi:hypothetical protein
MEAVVSSDDPPLETDEETNDSTQPAATPVMETPTLDGLLIVEADDTRNVTDVRLPSSTAALEVDDVEMVVEINVIEDEVTAEENESPDAETETLVPTRETMEDAARDENRAP